MKHLYILEEYIAVPVTDLATWEQWMQTADRKVDVTIIGDTTISTVFLGIDHSFGSGTPMLFETMTFCGDQVELHERYSTWEQAIAGHNHIVEELTGHLTPDIKLDLEIWGNVLQ